VNILVLLESEGVRAKIEIALGAAGHVVTGEADARRLAPFVSDAGALLVDPGCARHAIALLRDRGFDGRALVMADAPFGEAAAQDLGADGSIGVTPTEDVAARFAAALGGRRRLLIVDDSELAARLLQAELRNAGLDIHYAPDAETATSIMLHRATRPDLVLLDVAMPKVTGPQLCRFIKGNDRFRSIKVLLSSSAGRERMASLVAECGADGYIMKDDFLGKWIVENT
jgi:CheY-like chemotaxis protein